MTTTKTETTGYTLHGVLAGAYKGKGASLKACLQHASVDGGESSLCGKITDYRLADEFGSNFAVGVTCKACAAKVARQGLTLKAAE